MSALDWTHLRVIATGFAGYTVMSWHFRIRAVVARKPDLRLDLHLFTSLSHVLRLWRNGFGGVDRPEMTVVVSPDGHTNIPTPKQPSTSNETPLEPVVDLAVSHFELTNGFVSLNSQKQALDLRAENLRVQLWYSMLKQGYHGQISLEPLYVVSGRNTPVRFAVTLPVALGRDRIGLQGARVSTAASQIQIDASVDDLRHPKMSVHTTGHVALADLRNGGNLPLTLNAGQLLSVVDLDVNATVADNAIEVTRLHLGLGHSSVDAAGKLKETSGNGALVFQARLAVDELGRLLNVAARPDGSVNLEGTASLDKNNNYQVNGSMEAKGGSFLAGDTRISNVSLTSGVRLDPHRLNLAGLRLDAAGGELAADASLEDFARFNLNGALRHFDLRTVAGTMGRKDFAYAGVASGPVTATGDLNQPGTRSLAAHMRISIVPGRRGIPMSGRLLADYSGASNNINIGDSYIALPHTRLNLSGSLQNRLTFALTTRDLADLLAAVPSSGRPQVALDSGGQLTLAGAATGTLASPHVEAHLSANRFAVEGRRFDALALDATASSAGAAVSNGSLTRGAMQMQLAASVGLRNWKALPADPLRGAISISNGDLADLVVMAGLPSTGYSGALAATVNINGTVGNPLGSADLSITSGMIQGEPFDRLQAQANLADQLITIPSFYATAGPGRIDLSAEFQHPRDSFSTGRLHARIQTNQIELAQLPALQKQLPNAAGEVRLQAEVSGGLSETKSGTAEFLASAVSADASAHNLRLDGQSYGDFNATARTQQQTVHYEVSSNFAGSKIGLNGNTELARDYPTTADATIGNLPIEQVLKLAKRTDIPAKGNLTATLHVTGTPQKPQGNADLDLSNAVLYDEPIDHVRAKIAYLADKIDVSNFDAWCRVHRNLLSMLSSSTSGGQS